MGTGTGRRARASRMASAASGRGIGTARAFAGSAVKTGSLARAPAGPAGGRWRDARSGGGVRDLLRRWP